METTTYNVVRVNRYGMDEIAALDDMAVIIEAGFFWKMSTTFDAPVGSLMLAMGSHGGRGLYIFGMVSGLWEGEPKGDFRKRLPMLWQPAIYKHGEETVEQIAAMVTRFNYRFGSRNILPGQFADVLNIVMKGTVLSPDYHWRQDAVA